MFSPTVSAVTQKLIILFGSKSLSLIVTISCALPKVAPLVGLERATLNVSAVSTVTSSIIVTVTVWLADEPPGKFVVD